ncbi:hypothetical protein [Ekhidna sp.]
MEAAIFNTNDSEKLKKAFEALKKLGVSYTPISKQELLDIGLYKAIIEGEKTGEATRKEVFDLLD